VEWVVNGHEVLSFVVTCHCRKCSAVAEPGEHQPENATGASS
jgi:hypothetical protein